MVTLLVKAEKIAPEISHKEMDSEIALNLDHKIRQRGQSIGVYRKARRETF
jgi:hypothetical protein